MGALRRVVRGDLRASATRARSSSSTRSSRCPTPQSRDRMYFVFWRKGLQAGRCSTSARCPGARTARRRVTASSAGRRPPPARSVRSRASSCGAATGSSTSTTARTASQNVAPAVVGAKSIIDWSTPMARIGDRQRPLAPKTRERIRTGLKRLSTSEPGHRSGGRQPLRAAGLRPGVVGRRPAQDGDRLPVHGGRRPDLSEGTSVILRSRGPVPGAGGYAPADGHDHGPRPPALAARSAGERQRERQRARAP